MSGAKPDKSTKVSSRGSYLIPRIFVAQSSNERWSVVFAEDTDVRRSC